MFSILPFVRPRYLVPIAVVALTASGLLWGKLSRDAEWSRYEADVQEWTDAHADDVERMRRPADMQAALQENAKRVRGSHPQLPRARRDGQLDWAIETIASFRARGGRNSHAADAKIESIIADNRKQQAAQDAIRSKMRHP